MLEAQFADWAEFPAVREKIIAYLLVCQAQADLAFAVFDGGDEFVRGMNNIILSTSSWKTTFWERTIPKTSLAPRLMTKHLLMTKNIRNSQLS